MHGARAMGIFLMAAHLHIADMQPDRLLYYLPERRRKMSLERRFLSYGHITVFPYIPMGSYYVSPPSAIPAYCGDLMSFEIALLAHQFLSYFLIKP